MTAAIVRASVRSIVEYSLRSGDLESAFFGSARPVEGLRAHQRIQSARPDTFTGEVTVSRTVEADGLVLVVNGRIDGVWILPDRTVIEEIKSTSGDTGEAAEADNPLHWGQAKCYAAMYAFEHGLETVDVRLTYCQLDTGNTTDVVRTFSAGELEAFFSDIVGRYLQWAHTIAAWAVIRNESIRALPFPFDDYRPGQRRLAGAVYRTVRDGVRLIAQAPTGIGKTAAALYPSIKAIPEGNAGTIFYLTARTTGKSVAEKAIDDMRIGGLRLKSLTLTAKERICFRSGSACSPDECEYAKGHFDRINGACTELFKRDSFTRESIEESARNHRVCPFELSLEMALFSDCVICDYNYAFDPRVYLRRFFEEECGTYTFLVDEAHNLVDRARDMFSASVEKENVLALRKSLKGGTASIVKSLTGMNAVLLTHMKRCADSGNGIVDAEPPKSLIAKMRNFTTAAERWLAKNIPSPFREELADMYFAVNGFLKTAERYDERYVTLFTPQRTNLTVTLFCVDPSARMSEALERCRSAVFFSATLVPMEYFRDILGIGIGGETRELILPSPFPPENLLVLIADRISTLYRNRDKTSGGIARSIAALVGGRPGNYLVFFPSYAYMTTVHDSFAAMNPDIETIVQTQGMTEQERDSFLGRFNHDNAASLVGFAVMGGVFGEGIDLIGERLGGAVIVGVGLPGISPEREIIRSYFNEHGGRGFEYSYMFPGINKVLQAAGRVIRSETDRGVVLLIDERFGTARYRSLLPVEWVSATVDDNDDIRKQIVAF